MLFSGIPFLYYFLPLFLLCFFLTPKKGRNVVLLVFSLAFYAWGEPKYVLLMVATILVGYTGGLLIARFRGRRGGKWALGITAALLIAALGYFKYADFFIRNFNAATGLSVPLLRIALPIGISFYTFQLLSYLIDVQRGTPVQKNLLKLATYIALFPQLIAGPIVRYSDISRELDERTYRVSDLAYGARRFILGLSKKVLIANQLGALCAVFRVSGEKSVLFYWLYAIAFMLHVYFDFSGYSDMAIGLGRVCGFHFPENFNYPFISGSITEFWRRWHMTLGSWFRDYVYIPMGGNRTSNPRRLFNLLVVWMLTGLWHGAAWNFVLWGLLFAVLLIAEKSISGLLRGKGAWRHGYVLFFVLCSFVLFNADTLSQAAADLGGLFGAGGIPLLSAPALYYLKSYGVLLVLAAVGATPLVKIGLAKLSAHRAGSKLLSVAEPLALSALLLVCTAYLVDGSFNPFLYFRF